jgi:hypothetical protein
MPISGSPLLPIGGAPGPKPTYEALVRLHRPDVYWPGNMSVSVSAANYVMPLVFTLECWVKWLAGNTNTGIFSCWNSNGSMLWVATDGNIKFHVNGTDVSAGVGSSNGVWTYLVATYDGTYRTIFVNGAIAGGPTSGVTPVAATSKLMTHGYTGLTGNLSATVADAAVYSRALSPAEVWQHYLVGRIGRP